MAFKPRPAGRPAGTTRRPAPAKKAGGFVYHERSVDSVKARAERQGGGFETPYKNVDLFRPKAGDNRIRILPPTWEPHDHYALQVWVHAYMGQDSSTYLCPYKMLKKKCPICEAQKEAQAAGEADEAKAFAPKEQFVCWVVNRDEDEDAPPQLYAMSWTMDRDIAALCHDKRKGKILMIDHPDKGFDLSFKRQGQGFKTRYFGMAIDRESSPISDDPDKQEEVLAFIQENTIPNLLAYRDYNYLAAVIQGGAEESDPELDETEGEEVDGEEVADDTSEEYDEEAAAEAEAESENEAEEARQSMARDRARPKPTRPAARRAPPPEEEVEEDPPFETDGDAEDEVTEEEYDPETGEVYDDEPEAEEDNPPPPRRTPQRVPPKAAARPAPRPAARPAARPAPSKPRTGAVARRR